MGNVARRRKSRITIADLAKHLSVSKATVSLALNNSPLVAEQTKKRVLEAAEQFGYRPNYFGSRLSKGKSDVVGLYILGGEAEQCNWALPSSWMFYNPLIRAISAELSNHGYRLYLEVISLEQVMNQDVIFHTIQEESSDGIVLIVQDAIDYSFLDVVGELRFPFVVVNAKTSENISSIKVNNELGAFKAVEYLKKQGHSRIAHISGPINDLNAIERINGFIKAHTQLGLAPPHDLIFTGDWQRESGAKAAKDFLAMSKLPTAVFCANDHMAVGAMQALQAAGIRIPEDISLIGFDNAEITEIVVPNLTSVRQSLEKMGELAAKEILCQIDGVEHPIQHVNLEPQLVFRDSVTAVTRKSTNVEPA